MGKPIEREFAQGKTILKYLDYKGASCVVPSSMGTQGVVKAGTPFPSNDASCKGLLLFDVNVAQGDGIGTYVFEGSIDNKKLAENSVSVSPEAKAVLPRVTFFD